MKTYKTVIRVALGLLLVVSLSGCKFFVPAQANSNYRKPDKLNISLISLDDINNTNAPNVATNWEFITNYYAAFPSEKKRNKPSEQSFLPLAAPLLASAASYAASAVMGYVSQSFSNEAALYQESFLGNIQDDCFLKLDPTNEPPYNTANPPVYHLNYCGFKITRDVSISGDTNPVNAFTLICGIAPTADGELFRVKPLVFQTALAGAKVVGKGLLSWLVLYPHLFLNPDNKLNSQVSMSFDGYFRGQDQALQHMSMGAFSFKVSGYDLSKTNRLTASAKTIPSDSSGFLVSAPLSYASKPNATAWPTVSTVNAGNVDLTVTLIESDASNAKANFLKLGQWASQETPKITMLITNQIK